MLRRSLIMVTLTLLTSSIVWAENPQRISPSTDGDFYDLGMPSAAKVELGRHLFFDKILSGNLNISCATCHHPLTGTGDGLSLPVGEGGRGLGAARDNGSGPDAVHERVPRNAPPLFNLGALQFDKMFHDGRVEIDPSAPSGFRSPAGEDLPQGLDNVLAVQAMFPVTSGAEMAGQLGENDQADAAAVGNLAGPDGVWDLIVQKLRFFPEYAAMFQAAYPLEVQQADDITFVHAANAIAAFEAKMWRFDNSSFDSLLRGRRTALSPEARRGMLLFYGEAGCDDCHSGVFQTDQEFHAIAMPQIGPGKGDNSPGYADGHEDFGRERVTGDPADRFKFRTPTLRNVALTAPYGHSGSYDTLEAVVRHHFHAVQSLEAYDLEQATLPDRPDLDAQDLVVMHDPARRAEIAQANELVEKNLSEVEIRALLSFLQALTDPAALDMRGDIPEKVPSGLPIGD